VWVAKTSSASATFDFHRFVAILLVPYPAAELLAHPVNTLVNNFAQAGETQRRES